MKIGEIIRRFRKERKMTLAELSSKSGVALATLSRIENGIMTGTLESHMNIAKALGIRITDLYKDLSLSKEQFELRTKDKSVDALVHNKKSSSEILTGKAFQKKMAPVLIRLPKGGVTNKDQTKIGVEKFVYILEGKVEVDIGDEKYNLTKGDTVYFESSVPHCFKNTHLSESRLISVTA